MKIISLILSLLILALSLSAVSTDDIYKKLEVPIKA